MLRVKVNMFAYEKLEVWQLAKKLTIRIYKITKLFPSDEKYVLVSQLNRASVSIASNIAEGSSRSSFKEQAHFSQMAYGSLMEISCQLEIAKELGFIDNDTWLSIYKDLELLAQKLSALRTSQLKRCKP